jgi:hypothetical protein
MLLQMEKKQEQSWPAATMRDFKVTSPDLHRMLVSIDYNSLTVKGGLSIELPEVYLHFKDKLDADDLRALLEKHRERFILGENEATRRNRLIRESRDVLVLCGTESEFEAYETSERGSKQYAHSEKNISRTLDAARSSVLAPYLTRESNGQDAAIVDEGDTDIVEFEVKRAQAAAAIAEYVGYLKSDTVPTGEVVERYSQALRTFALAKRPHELLQAERQYAQDLLRDSSMLDSHHLNVPNLPDSPRGRKCSTASNMAMDSDNSPQAPDISNATTAVDTGTAMQATNTAMQAMTLN